MIKIPKVHSRKKRLMGLATATKHRFVFLGIPKKKGDRTFRTKEQAESHAKEKGMKGFEVAPAKKNKRFKIVSKE